MADDFSVKTSAKKTTELNLNQLDHQVLLLFNLLPPTHPLIVITPHVLPQKHMITGALTLKKLPFLSCFMG